MLNLHGLTMNDTNSSPPPLDGSPRRLSHSILWDLQRRFFEHWGPAAWNQGIVPHYVTSNPFIARAYCRVVLGWLRDCRYGAASPTLDLSQPVYLLDVGAGAGRFAYHFLRRFLPAWQASTLRDVPVTYVMADFTEHNLTFWRGHASLRPFVEAGHLDFAIFNPIEECQLRLQVSGRLLAPGTIVNPVAVLANYLFDCIPQDAFAIVGGQLHECLVTVGGPEPEPADRDMFAHCRVSYEQQPANGPCYDDDDWNAVLRGYAERLDDTIVLFPVAALRCLGHLRELAGGRLLLLSADKGYGSEEELLSRPEPNLARHGCFSLMVNYHALAEVARRQGGQALLTPHQHAHIVVAAFLFGQPPGDWGETRLAYDEAICQGGPDDFFSLKKCLDLLYDHFSSEQFLAYLRLSGHDARILTGAVSALLPRLSGANESLRREMRQAVAAVWENYFPIGEEQDLANDLGSLLMALACYADALVYFGHSLREHGPRALTFFRMALCHYHLGDVAAAARDVGRALELEPGLGPARALRMRLEVDAGRNTALPGTPALAQADNAPAVSRPGPNGAGGLPG
jgi:tetratricopeptide (TPR) repeat protein